MNMKIRLYRNLLAWLMIAVVVSATSCSDDDDDKADPTLYTRLGGIDAITLVVDKFLTNVAADNVINGRFEGTVASESRFRLLRTNLIDQVCAGAGGPCIYKGKTMLEAHTGMDISDDEFNALVGDLVSALDFYDVPDKEKNDLLAILGPMKTDIVGK